MLLQYFFSEPEVVGAFFSVGWFVSILFFAAFLANLGYEVVKYEGGNKKSAQLCLEGMVVSLVLGWLGLTLAVIAFVILAAVCYIIVIGVFLAFAKD